jgi:hypothetical protein
MRRVAVAAGACLVLLTGCPSSSSSSASGSASATDSGSASDAGSASDSGSVPAQGYLADAAAAAPYVSKEGRFTVSVPSGIKPYETTAGVRWTVGGASLVAGYYDGRPRGVDRSHFYDLARDGVGGSAIEKEDDAKIAGFPTRMRRIRLVLPGKGVQWRRGAIVIAGDRTYEVSCTSTAHADLDSPVVDQFFTTFHVDGTK